MEMHRWKIEIMIKNFFCYIWSGLKAIWFLIVGYPMELTYWFEGTEFKVQVRKFKEIKPNHIMFKNIDSDKHVVIKSDIPIKYIIREE